MTYPVRIEGARICVLRYPDETTICANIAGFRSLGEWLGWLATSNPAEKFHFHLLLHLESEASHFDGVRPTNIWFLSQTTPLRDMDIPDGPFTVQQFELTFQVVSETDLDELAENQDSGIIPARFQK